MNTFPFFYLDKSSSDLTTSTDPSSSEQSCDTVIYRGPRDDDGTDAESPPVYLPSLNSADCRAVMSRVLRGSTAELPPAKYRSLDRKQARSPRLAVSPAAASPTSSQQSTPVRTLHGRSGSGSTGSLPRNNNTGKMPLCGKVAGYRQPAALGGTSAAASFGHEVPVGGGGLELHHHNSHQQHHHHHHRLSNAGSGLSYRSSRGSDPQQHQHAPKQQPEVWVDTVPSCDKDVITHPHPHPSSYIPGYEPYAPGANGGVAPGYPSELRGVAPGYNPAELQSLYGYMDEHKKQMIQEWVEGQALAHNHAAPRPGPPPPNLTGLESLAWLEAASGLAAAANSSSYRVFTQFKMAESSTSSCSEEVSRDCREIITVRGQSYISRLPKY